MGAVGAPGQCPWEQRLPQTSKLSGKHALSYELPHVLEKGGSPGPTRPFSTLPIANAGKVLLVTRPSGNPKKGVACNDKKKKKDVGKTGSACHPLFCALLRSPKFRNIFLL